MHDAVADRDKARGQRGNGVFPREIVDAAIALGFAQYRDDRLWIDFALFDQVQQAGDIAGAFGPFQSVAALERVRARNLCPPNGAVLSLPGGQRRDLIGRDNFHAYPTGAGVGISSRRSDRRDKARASIPFATTVLARRVWPLGAADPRYRTNPAARHRTLHPRPRNALCQGPGIHAG